MRNKIRYDLIAQQEGVDKLLEIGGQNYTRKVSISKEIKDETIESVLYDIEKLITNKTNKDKFCLLKWKLMEYIKSSEMIERYLNKIKVEPTSNTSLKNDSEDIDNNFWNK